MQKARDRRNIFTTLLAALVVLSSASALGQAPITAPLFNVLDFSGDTGAFPLLEVQGGQTSSTLGIEVTSQSTTTTTSNLPNLGAIMGSGFGGMSLVQTSPANNTTGIGQGSPSFCISGNQWSGTTGTMGSSVAAVWCLQVLGGSVSNLMDDTSDIIVWSRPSGTGYGNPTGNITMLWPGAINIASNGQMTVGPTPSGLNADASLNLSTFTGQKNGYANAVIASKAGPITIEPGQLTSTTTVASGSTEGALQILQSYIAVGTTTAGRLACPSGTPQSVTNCITTGAAENWVGVFNNILGAQGVSVTPLRYGRVSISTFGTTGVTFGNGDFVCKDDDHGGYVKNSVTPCPIGESIGIAVGDPGTPPTTHLVDLVAEASVSGATAQGLILQFLCAGKVAASATVYLAGQPCSISSTGVMSNTTEHTALSIRYVYV